MASKAELSVDYSKKKPTRIKPFRLSASNSKNREISNYLKQKENEEKKTIRKFKARPIPTSHKVPFMVLHSTNTLTQPKGFSL